MSLKKTKSSAEEPQKKKSSEALKSSELNEFNLQTNKAKKKVTKD